MPVQQGDLDLLNNPTAQNLLQSSNPAKLAYVWKDGTPRVVPMWFHWDGEAIVMAGPANAPKIKALRERPQVAVTIDDNNWPYAVLLLRGTARIDIVQGLPPEYAAAAERYFGPEQGRQWVQQVSTMTPESARIAVTPEWAGLIDFQTRFPSALGI